MTYFIKSGENFFPTDEENMDIHKRLPVGTFIIKEKPDPTRDLYFERVDDFVRPSGKIYGDLEYRAERILNTYNSRNSNTGVLLFGDKGSGKTMLARQISLLGYEQNIPTLIIVDKLEGQKFNKLIQDIEQDCIVIFDEFEKVYRKHHDEQAGLLTLLDGVFQSKKLFVLTANDKYRIDEHFMNRPGRIFYSIEYKGLDKNFVLEYANDNLKNKSDLIKLEMLSDIFDSFNFDMLKALIEEMNRYDEDVISALKMININPNTGQNSVYNAKLSHETMKVSMFDKRITVNPFNINYWIDVDFEDDEERNDVQIYVTSKDLVKYDMPNGRFEYHIEGGYKLTLSKEQVKVFDFEKLL